MVVGVVGGLIAGGCATDVADSGANKLSADGGSYEDCDGGLCEGAALPDGGQTAPPGELPGCQPRACDDDECGLVDDGCGGSMHCGPCDEAPCVPKRCEDLDATCGTPDDGCGGQLECGACAAGSSCTDNRCGCTADSAEVNDRKEAAFRLGEVREGEVATFRQLDAMNFHQAGDVDWYRARIVDVYNWFGGTFQNGQPRIHVRVTGDSAIASQLEVTALFECDGGATLEQTCTSSNPYRDENGVGCLGQAGGGDLVMRANCAWQSNDSGTLFIRVRATGDAVPACSAYNLRLEAN